MRWPFRPWHYRLWIGEDAFRASPEKNTPTVFDHAWTIEIVGIAFALGVAAGMLIVWVLK